MKVVMVENYNVSHGGEADPCLRYFRADLPGFQGSIRYRQHEDDVKRCGDTGHSWTAQTLRSHDLVGEDNIYIFGENSEQVIDHYAKADYVSREFYEKSPVIKAAVDFIVSDQAARQSVIRRIWSAFTTSC